MRTIKIGIVEDDLIIAEAIAEMLRECGYEVTEPAMRYSEAIEMAEREAPDLPLLDVDILGRMDGIEVGRTIQRSFGIPFIFLTANTDFDTISRAKDVAPAAFLAKPITKAQLYAAIEIALANYRAPAASAAHPDAAQVISRARPIFVKEAYSFRKVDEDEILFAESEQNYVALQLTDGRRVSVRATITDLAEQLTPPRFVRTHRSFIVAVDRIEQLSGNSLLVGSMEVPLSKAYREALLQLLHIHRRSI